MKISVDNYDFMREWLIKNVGPMITEEIYPSIRARGAAGAHWVITEKLYYSFADDIVAKLDFRHVRDCRRTAFLMYKKS